MARFSMVGMAVQRNRQLYGHKDERQRQQGYHVMYVSTSVCGQEERLSEPSADSHMELYEYLPKGARPCTREAACDESASIDASSVI